MPRRAPGTVARAAGVGLAAVVALGTTLLAGPAHAAAPNDWPAPNHDGSNTRANTSEWLLNTFTAGGLTVKWKVGDLEGSTGTPAVVGGVAYLTGWDGTVRAVDARTGAARWKTLVTAGYPGTKPDGLAHGSVSGSPAVADGKVFVGTEEGSIAALNATTGAILWKTQPDTYDVATIWSSPTVVGGRVIIGTGLFRIGNRNVVGVGDKGGTYAVFDRATGASVWGRHLTDGSHLGGDMQTAAVNGGVVYVSSNTMPDALEQEDPLNKTTVCALNAGDGSTRWQKDLPSAGFGAITWAAGLVYVPTVRGGLYVLQDSEGRQVVELKPNGSDGGGSTVSLGGGVSVSNGMVYPPYGWWFYGPNIGGDAGGVTAFSLF